MIGIADLFVNLHGPPTGEPTVKDPNGKGWEMVIKNAFMFEFVKDKNGKNGILFRHTKIFSDSGPLAVVKMIKKGSIKPEDLMK